jgi:hypothetical protein
MARPLEQPAVGKRFRVVEHRNIENLDLGLHIAGEHCACEVFHELWWILVDLFGKIH